MVEAYPGEADDPELPDVVLQRLRTRWETTKRLGADPVALPTGSTGDLLHPLDADVSGLIEGHLEARRARKAEALRGDLRRRVAAGPPAGAAERIEAALAAAGEGPRLDEARAALEDGKLARRLAGLAAGVRALVPETPELRALAKEGAKQAVTNALDPYTAAALAVGDAARKVKALKAWEGMPPGARVATVAGLAGNMADIVAAVAPPPANVAATAMGVGLSLVAIAADPEGARPAAPDPRPAPTGPLRRPAAPAPRKAPAGTAKLQGPAARPARGTAPLRPAQPQTGRLPAVPAPLAERGENLVHNVRDRLTGLWARLSRALAREE